MRGNGFWSDNSGTSSLEVVLLMPFVALLLVVALNVGSAPQKKIDAHMASRFAGTTFTRILTLAPMRDGASSFTQSAVARAYPGVTISIGSAPTIWASPVGALGNRSRMTATTAPPASFGNLLSLSPARSTFVIEGVTWTYDDIPISLGELSSVIGRLAGALGQGLGPLIAGLVGGFFKALTFISLWFLGS